MTAVPPEKVRVPDSDGTTLLTRLAAIGVILALGALAAYSLFGGPTTVSVRPAARVAPARVGPAGGEPNPEQGGAGGGD